jgi:hypothetical protein
MVGSSTLEPICGRAFSDRESCPTVRPFWTVSGHVPQGADGSRAGTCHRRPPPRGSPRRVRRRCQWSVPGRTDGPGGTDAATDDWFVRRDHPTCVGRRPCANRGKRWSALPEEVRISGTRERPSALAGSTPATRRGRAYTATARLGRPLGAQAPMMNSNPAVMRPTSTRTTKTRSLIRPTIRRPTQAPATTAGVRAAP